MAGCGRRAPLRWAGHHIVSVIGFGFRPGAGPGLTMPLGASLRSTMAGEFTPAAIGAGYRGRSMCARVMRLRWWHGLAAPTGASEFRVVVWDGSRLAMANLTFP